MNTTTNLATIPCTALKGVGIRVAEKLTKVGISTVQDLIFHLPAHYQDRTHIARIADLRQGDFAVIEATIEKVETNKFRRPTLLIHLNDGSSYLVARFFHFTASQRNGLQPGMKLRCIGEVRYGYRSLEMIHPEYRRITTDEPMPVEETLTPIYPTTEGLQQRSLRSLTEQALIMLSNGAQLPEYVPDFIREQHHFLPINETLLFVHRPPPDASRQQLEEGQHPAQKRLAFEELLAHQLSVRRLRYQMQKHFAPEFSPATELEQQFKDNLSFTLTNAQQRVGEEIKHDLQKSQPMMRLVQGDVGSGKTVVAAIAMLQAVANSYQAALMAPTDLLAEQHQRNFSQWLEPLGIKLAWLAGKHKGKKREAILQELASGEAQIIVGTHALFQEQVQFKKLGLVVIDEQHRFGVHQRLALREKGKQQNHYPHQLIMTATPIPRTLAMTAYADLDVSIVDELPPGRTPVKTVALANNKRLEVVERIRQACLQKRQAYWVCTLIEESEALQCQAAEATKEQLVSLLPELNIGLVHGRMKAAEKDAVMQAFKQGEIDLLVATTVIEVGVDVPNASLMVVENAERLGLSQLHQLRGRVGRGATESFCVLLYQAPLSAQSKTRLQVMRETTDGFVIAQHDLELRGPGELLGTKQTGLMRFRIANLQRDQGLLPQVQQAAEAMLSDGHYQKEIKSLIRRWLPQGEVYGAV